MFLRYTREILQVLVKPRKAICRPLNLQLEITTACNSKCQMCNHKETIKKPGQMSFSQFKKIIDEVSPLKLNLTGYGESFLNKDLFRMIRYAKSKRIRVNFATNFTLAKDKITETCDSKVDLIKISIDAANKHTYRKIRGIDCFEEVIKNIKRINAFKVKHNLKYPVLRFNFALQKDNLEEINEVIRLANKLSIEAVYVQYLEFVNMEGKKKEIVGGIKSGYLRKKLEEARELSFGLKIKTNLEILLRDFDYYYNKMLPAKDFVDSKRICHFPWLTTYIEYNGDVRPCQMFVWKRKEGVLGNVFKDGFQKVWNNNNYLTFRQKTKKRLRPFTPCKSCIPQTYENIFYIYSKLLPGWSYWRK